ncbi:MAG: SpoIIE family protein phosphatase [Planctomycetes bacterium]|nr:SpoIIE family protein phosphatase [Planctomycetota bacterium]
MPAPGAPPSARRAPPARGPARGPAKPQREEEPEELGSHLEQMVADEDAAPERTSAEIKPTGMSLGIKFACMIAGTVAGASLLLILFARGGTSQAVDEEINDAGVRMVKVLGSLDFSFWVEVGSGSSPAGQKMLQKVKDILQSVGKTITKKPPSTPQEKTEQDDAVNDLTKAFEDIQKAVNSQTSEDPLARMGDAEVAKTMGVRNPDVIDLVITQDKNGQKQAVCQMKKGASISLPGRRKIADSDGVEIHEASYSSQTFSGRARSFTKPVLNKQGIEEGQVVLFLSARKIDEVQSKMMSALLIPGALAVAIGAVVGFFLASFVTKPVKVLIHDIQAVAEGDLGHQTKAHSADEIGIVAKAFNSMTRSLQVAHEAELSAKALEHELNIATEIQSNLLPRKIPKIPGFDISAYYRPSKEVGGDYYDFIPIDADNLGIVVADVSGKGIPGSMVMTMARSLLRMEAERNLSTADTLVKTNRILAKDIRRGMFVTAMYMILNVKTRTLLVSSAGHNPLHVWRGKTRTYELINPNGIALGFDKGPIFERTVKEQRIQLYPGDRFTGYTDGVVEAMNATNDEFGDERFFQLCQKLAEKDSNQLINVVVKELDEHKGSAPQHDDITLLTFRLAP